MIESIRCYTDVFPEEDWPGAGYWHLHVPVDQAFIDSHKTPHWVRRQCVQCLIDQSEHLQRLKSELGEPTRVVVSISLPYLWDSQIAVLFDQKYFSTYFERDSEGQTLTPLRESRSLSREWGLEIPGTFQERGYHEHIRDEDYSRDGELWFFGELD